MPNPDVASIPDDAATEAPAASEQDGLSALQKVEALLAPKPATEPETAGDVPAAAETPLSVASLAEKLQADPKAIYALEVPLADGETVTLGALKDAYKPAAALAKEREAFLEERGRHDAERRQTQTELDALLRALPPEALNPDVIRQAQAALAENVERERAELLKAIPDWKDPVKLQADRVAIEDYVARFGFSKADLAGVQDHRLLRLVRDAALRVRELDAVKPDKPARPVKVAQAPKPSRTSTPAQEFGRVKAAVTMRRMQPLDAVRALLEGK